MPVFQQGSVNTTALIVPDLYVQIVPPQITLLNGVPTNVVGVVGTASWGPVNSPTTVSDMGSYSKAFGPIKARKYDLGTAVAAAVQQGANNFRCVRVTDGTDIAASSTIVCATNALALAIASAINLGTSGIRGPSKLVVASVDGTDLTLTAIYTGSLGNSLSAVAGAGSAAGTSKISIALPGGIPEIFDNIGAASIADTTAEFVDGTDGATTITSAVLVGSDDTPRKGMYALRNTETSIGVLADADDSEQLILQVAFGLSEGIYMIATGPAGQTIADAIDAKATAGIDSYAMKLLLGDWCYWQDNVNNQRRLISPQGFVAGRLANLSPEQSSLNKPIYGIIATQATANNLVYSAAELAQLVGAGIDLITNPVPGGNYFGCRIGHNTSSNKVINGDNYTRMTNYIAYTLNAGMGMYIGRLGSKLERAEAYSTLDMFGASMKNLKPEPMIDDYSIEPIGPVVGGLQVANAQFKYLDIVEKFLINVEGGASVQISRISTTQA